MVAVPGRAGVRGAAGGRAGSFRNARASGRVPGLHERWRVHIGAGQVRYGAGRRQRAARCPLRPRPSRRVAAPLTGLPRTGGVPRGPAWVAETSRRARSWAIHGGCSADLGRRARGLRVRCSANLTVPDSAAKCYDVPGCTANWETGCRVVSPATGPYRDIRANMEQTWVRPILGRCGRAVSPEPWPEARSQRTRQIRSVIAAAWMLDRSRRSRRLTRCIEGTATRCTSVPGTPPGLSGRRWTPAPTWSVTRPSPTHIRTSDQPEVSHF